MQQKDELMMLDEPMGIVISRGSREETAPRFRAYIWSEEIERAVPVDPAQHAA